MYIYIKETELFWLAIFKSILPIWLYVSLAIMISRFGEVAEWSNVLDSKSSVVFMLTI